jgi:Rieske Fe-S protein
MRPESGPSNGRRKVLNWLLGTSLGGLFASIAFPVAKFLSPPDVPEAATNEVDAGRVDDPELIEKGFKIVRFGNDPVILVRVAEGEFKAFSAICTHLDCIVEYRQDRELLWCWCHNGAYDLEGRNIAGPPPRPLTPFSVHVVEGQRGAPKNLVISRA